MGLRPTPDPEPAGYPAELAGEVVLADGTPLHLRAIRPEDSDGLVEFHSALTQWTIYLRFFSAHRELSDEEVRWFTHVDYHDRLALVAELGPGADPGPPLVGVGRYDRLPETADAEVAFVVADGYQHHGLGTVLLDRLAQAAWPRGITHFVAEVLVGNAAMLRVFFDSHYAVEWDQREGTIQLRFPIDPAGRVPGGPAPNHRVR